MAYQYYKFTTSMPRRFANPFHAFLRPLFLGGWLLFSGVATAEDAPFVSIKCGRLQISSSEMPAQKTIAIDRGKVMALYYDREEVVNSVKVSTPEGEVILLTKSLDKAILLQTTSLTPGEYLIEVGSAGQKIESRLVVK